jgi:hypothetical protein
MFSERKEVCQELAVGPIMERTHHSVPQTIRYSGYPVDQLLDEAHPEALFHPLI